MATSMNPSLAKVCGTERHGKEKRGAGNKHDIRAVHDRVRSNHIKDGQDTTAKSKESTVKENADNTVAKTEEAKKLRRSGNTAKKLGSFRGRRNSSDVDLFVALHIRKHRLTAELLPDKRDTDFRAGVQQPSSVFATSAPGRKSKNILSELCSSGDLEVDASER